MTSEYNFYDSSPLVAGPTKPWLYFPPEGQFETNARRHINLYDLSPSWGSKSQNPTALGDYTLQLRGHDLLILCGSGGSGRL